MLTAEHHALLRKERPAPVRAGSPLAIVMQGRTDFRACGDAMRAFTDVRSAETPDELWVVEHPPVYTAGVATRAEHFPRRDDIPLERTDRGGQITYHGPGQAIVYCLVDLSRRRLSVGAMVECLEQAVIELLRAHAISAHRRPGAPGVYVADAKIAALGLRVRRSRTYHGVSLNVDMDLAPFDAIDPCGYPGLRVTQTSAHGVAERVDVLGAALAGRIASLLESR